MANNNLSQAVRIVDDFKIIGGIPSTTYWQKQAIAGVRISLRIWLRSDPGWHVFKVWRTNVTGINVAGFQIDETAPEGTTLPVPTSALQPFLMSYGADNDLSLTG